MRGSLARLLPLVLVACVAAACDDNDTTTTTPTTTTTTTETFTGTLNTNGSFTYPIVVIGSGTITATLVVLSPDNALPIGLALGTWNGSACQIVLTNDSAIQSSSVSGLSTAPGDFCVRVADAAGTLAQAESYTIQVTHP
jgi:hypothetical protein